MTCRETFNAPRGHYIVCVKQLEISPSFTRPNWKGIRDARSRNKSARTGGWYIGNEFAETRAKVFTMFPISVSGRRYVNTANTVTHLYRSIVVGTIVRVIETAGRAKNRAIYVEVVTRSIRPFIIRKPDLSLYSFFHRPHFLHRVTSFT